MRSKNPTPPNPGHTIGLSVGIVLAAMVGVFVLLG